MLSIGPGEPMGLSFKWSVANDLRSSVSNLMTWTYGLYTDVVTAQWGTRSGAKNGANYGQTGDYLTQGQWIMRDGTVAMYGNEWWYQYPDEYTIDANLLLSSVQYPNGVRLDFHYRFKTGGGFPGARLQSIVSNTGYHLKFRYKSDSDSSNDWYVTDKIIAINGAYEYCDPTALNCSLSMSWDQIIFTPAGEIVDPNGNAWQMGMTWIKSPANSSPEIQYGITYINKWECSPVFGCSGWQLGARVTSATVGGVTSTYSYATVGGVWRVTRTGPDGTSTFDSVPGRPGVTRHVDPLGRVSQFTYDYSGQMLSATWPEGNRVEIVRDSRGNPTQTRYISKTGAITTAYQAFPACGPYGVDAVCNQPSSVTDLNGNTTNYTYATHGGVLTEVGPAVGGVSPAKKYSYAQRYAWVKNAAGAYVQASSPVWLVTEQRSCKTTALNLTNGTCAGGASDLVVTSYDYGPNSGPNNLLLRGVAVTADGQTLRTCYGYDRRGRKISETQPNANLGSCA